MGTRLWGPLGWMTLHSITLNYPDNPTDSDKKTIAAFIDAFSSSITCPTCRQHFRDSFFRYKKSHVDWDSSKYNLFLMSVRIHNAVNKKLDKPSPRSVSESLEKLRNNTVYTSLAMFRSSYIGYVIQNWTRENTGEGMMLLARGREMQKINNEYFSMRECDLSKLNFPEANVFDEFSQITPPPIPIMRSNGGLRLLAGRMRFG
jgi:hypothetical protein